MGSWSLALTSGRFAAWEGRSLLKGPVPDQGSEHSQHEAKHKTREENFPFPAPCRIVVQPEVH